MQIADTRHETTPTLNELVGEVTKACLDHPERYKSIGVYALMMEIIEPALFKAVIEASRYNQTKAAGFLGLSRVTFRERLRQYFGDTYFNRRMERNDE